MKKISALLIFLLCLGCSALAENDVFPYSFGTYLTNYDMTEPLSSHLYWYVYAGRDYLSQSIDEAHRGKYSLKFDAKNASMASNSGDIIFNFATTPVENLYRYDNNDIFCEFFVKGAESNIGNMKFSCYFTFEDNTLLNFKDFEYEASENGWIRVYGKVSGDEVKNFKTAYMSVLYLADGNENGSFYLDDMSMRIVPSEIKIQDINLYIGENVCLSDVIVEGMCCDGRINYVSDYENIKWLLTDGDASVENDILKYNGHEDGDVFIKCCYLGSEMVFKVTFKRKTYYEISEYIDESVNVSIINNYHKERKVNVVIALYDGSSLFNVYNSSGIVNAFENKVFEFKKVHIPHIINNPVMVCYLFNDDGEYEKIEFMN